MKFTSSILALCVAVAVAAPHGHEEHHKPAPRCKHDEFFYGPKSCCLPHGIPHKHDKPPAHKRCPGDWYWHGPSKCCVPAHPSPPTPKCDKDWFWHAPSFCCEPKPKPHHHHHHPIPGKDYPIKPLPKPKAKPTKTTTVTVTAAASPSAVSQCNTGGVHCCNQVQSSTNSDATKVLDAFGVKIDNTKTGNNQTNVGINCSPKDGTGANCVEQPVCCDNNSFKGGDGSIVIGCSPINIFIS